MNKCIPLISEVTLFCKVVFMTNATRSFYYNSSSQPHHVYFLSIHIFFSLSLIQSSREIVRNMIRIVEPEVVEYQVSFPEYKTMFHLCESLVSKKMGQENASALANVAKTISMQSNWSNYAAMALAFFLPDVIEILEGKDGKEKATISFVSNLLNEHSLPTPLIKTLILLNSFTSEKHNLQLEAIVGSKMVGIRELEVEIMSEELELRREKEDFKKIQEAPPSEIIMSTETLASQQQNTAVFFSSLDPASYNQEESKEPKSDDEK